MKKLITFLTYCTLLFTFAWHANGGETYTNILNETPDANGFFYSCSQMVSVVNELRHMGKDKVMSVLTNVVEQANQNEGEGELFMLCRLLFVNTNGWKMPGLGAPYPPVNFDVVTNEFPIFPLALSDGVPFFLLNGYQGGGRPEAPDECVAACRDLPLISSDLPTNGFALAAQKLIASDSFHRLYKPSYAAQLIPSMIQRQAINPFLKEEH